MLYTNVYTCIHEHMWCVKWYEVGVGWACMSCCLYMLAVWCVVWCVCVCVCSMCVCVLCSTRVCSCVLCRLVYVSHTCVVHVVSVRCDVQKNTAVCVLWSAFASYVLWHECVCVMCVHAELPVKLLDYFLQSNKSNINQSVCEECALCVGCGELECYRVILACHVV